MVSSLKSVSDIPQEMCGGVGWRDAKDEAQV